MIKLDIGQITHKREATADTFLDRVGELIDKAEKQLGSGYGGAKRQMVYAQLLKEFPKQSKKDVSFAIEKVLQG